MHNTGCIKPFYIASMETRSLSQYQIFEDRYDAGKKLSLQLRRFMKGDTCILALPRGGVEVAVPISEKFHLPVDVIIARKITAQAQPEFAIGALSEFDITYMNNTMTRHLRLSQHDIDNLIRSEKKELERRIKLYRNNRNLSYIFGKTVLLVDDGVATGLTAKAAIESTRMLNPKHIIFVTPVCAKDSLPILQRYADSVVSILTPHNLRAVGNYYRHFEQISDDRVIELLSNHSSLSSSHHHSSYKLF